MGEGFGSKPDDPNFAAAPQVNSETQAAIEKLKKEYGHNLIPKTAEPAAPLDTHAEAIKKLKEKLVKEEKWKNSTIGKIWQRIRN